MLEPSKPMPSLNRSSSKSSMGIEKCCQIPGKSMNLRSTICTPSFLASFRTSFGVVGIGISLVESERDWAVLNQAAAFGPRRTSHGHAEKSCYEAEIVIHGAGGRQAGVLKTAR